MVTSQRRRVMLCVQSSRWVPCSSETSSGAASTVPTRPGINVSQAMRPPRPLKRTRNWSTACWQDCDVLAPVHEARWPASNAEAMLRPVGSSTAASAASMAATIAASARC